MALDFPAAPTNGQLFTDPQGTVWKWDGVKWTAATIGNYVPLSGGTMSGPLILSGDPTTPLGAADKQYVDNGPASRNVGRNLLHNPLFNVQQRGAGPWTTQGAYGPDRWYIYVSGGDTISVTAQPLNDTNRSQIGDESAAWCLQNTFVGVAAGTNFVDQHIESVRRLSGKTVVVSFWAATSAAGGLKLGANLFQLFGSGGSPSSAVTVMPTGNVSNLTGTFARFSFVATMPSVAGKTFGTTPNTDSTYLRFYYSAGASSSEYNNSGNIGAQSGTVYIWGVQLEIAQPGQTQPTPLEKPEPQQDLAKCQRFYEVNTQFYGGGYGTAGGVIYSPYTFAVAKRAVPSVSLANAGVANITTASPLSVTAAAFSLALTITAAGIGNGTFSFTASADL